ncbi:MAG: HAD family phosphatase [Chitinophagia bacterium]|nr:HAD family phosphatase [Chitinophagia bacterium]
MIEGIRHIIFDLGGVILNIDYQLTSKAFEAAGVTQFDELYSQLKQTTVFDDLETGKMSREAFIAAMQAAANTPISEAQVLAAWNAMLIDFPIRRLQILQQLRPYYDLFLLSNTNEIHEEAFHKLLDSSHGIPHLGTFFDKVYFSHRVGLRKPMPEIFELVLQENGLKPQETLFIDDSPQHIAAARALGIVTIYLENGMTIEKDIFKPKAATN